MKQLGVRELIVRRSPTPLTRFFQVGGVFRLKLRLFRFVLAPLFPIDGQQIPHVFHQTERGEFLFEIVGRSSLQPIGDFRDEQFRKFDPSPPQLLPQRVGRD